MINERMQELINVVSKGNKRAFANLVGVTPTVLENIVGTRKGKPGYDLLEKISFAIENINLDWLFTGRGSMLYTPQSPEGMKPEPSPLISPPSKPDESILYNMYKDEKAEKEKIRLEKESEIKELNAKMLTMSEEIGKLKAQLGIEIDKEMPDTLRAGAAEDASTKKRSLQPAHGIPFANAPSDGQHQ